MESSFGPYCQLITPSRTIEAAPARAIAHAKRSKSVSFVGPWMAAWEKTILGSGSLPSGMKTVAPTFPLFSITESRRTVMPSRCPTLSVPLNLHG